MDPRPPDPSPKAVPVWRLRVEDALILLAIPVLWLTVLRLSGPWVFAAQIVALAAMVVIFFVRVRRMLAARRQAEDDARRL
jgi:membrane protein implicated in regulation of membrane protease activity